MKDLKKFVESYYKKTTKLKEKFKATEENIWSGVTICCELNVQIGHFASLMPANNDYLKDSVRNIKDVADEICDIIFQIFNLIKYYKIKLNFWESKCFYDFEEESLKLDVNNLLLSIVIVSGRLSDAALRREKYKDNLNISDGKEYENIRENIYYLLILVYILSKKLTINLYNAYNKMIYDAQKYLNSFLYKGKYCTLNISNNKISKIIKINNLQTEEKNIFRLCMGNDPVNSINSYNKKLEIYLKNISLPKIYKINNNKDICIIQEFIQGYTLKETIKELTKKTSKNHKKILFNIYTRILEDIYSLSNSNIRIDSNINNFLITGNLYKDELNIYLVDITPPIYTDKLQKIKDHQHPLVKLNIDICYQITSYYYYFIKEIIINIKREQKLHEWNDFIYSILLYTDKFFFQLSNKNFYDIIKNIDADFYPFSLYLNNIEKLLSCNYNKKSEEIYQSIMDQSFIKYINIYEGRYKC